jgi:hypothetical protein
VRRVAALLFFVAVGTDFADGWVARRYREESRSAASPTTRGCDLRRDRDRRARADRRPAAPCCLADRGGVHPVRARFAHALRVGLFPSRLGRWNGIAYYVIAAIPIVRDALGARLAGPALLERSRWR